MINLRVRGSTSPVRLHQPLEWRFGTGLKAQGSGTPARGAGCWA